MGKITSEDKLYFPKDKITKKELIDYYKSIFPLMLPLIEDRVLTLHRYPSGILEKGFLQKSHSGKAPSFLKLSKVKKKDGSTIQMHLVNNVESLLYFVNLGTITFHSALNKKNSKMPDRIVFDLDPPSSSFSCVKEAAVQLKKILEEELGLKCLLMTTGSKGLHIYVPIEPKYSYEMTRMFAKDVATYLCSKDPKKFTIETRKEKRKGRVFIDYLRNSFSQTSVAPYSVRALDKAPIAMPIAWSELEKENFNSQSYSLKNIKKISRKKQEEWSKLALAKQKLKTPINHLRELLNH